MIESVIKSVNQVMDNGVPSIWNGMSKFDVSFESGHMYTFFSKGPFKGQIGQTLKFEPKKDQNGVEKGTASIVRENSYQKPYNNTGYKSRSKDETISRLAVLKASAEYHSQRLDSTDDTVVTTADKWVNWVNNG